MKPTITIGRVEVFESGRVCHFCGLPIPAGEKAIEAQTRNGWAHFGCWYDGTPLQRDSQPGERCA